MCTVYDGILLYIFYFDLICIYGFVIKNDRYSDLFVSGNVLVPFPTFIAIQWSCRLLIDDDLISIHFLKLFRPLSEVGGEEQNGAAHRQPASHHQVNK